MAFSTLLPSCFRYEGSGRIKGKGGFVDGNDNSNNSVLDMAGQGREGNRHSYMHLPYVSDKKEKKNDVYTTLPIPFSSCNLYSLIHAMADLPPSIYNPNYIM